MEQEEFFGPDAQKTLLRRGRLMFEVARDDPRFTYYGRAVGLASPDDGAVDLLRALAALQGASHYSLLPTAEIPDYTATAEALGLSATHFRRWRPPRNDADSVWRSYSAQ